MDGKLEVLLFKDENIHLTDISVTWFTNISKIYQEILVDILIQNIGVIEIDKEKKKPHRNVGKNSKNDRKIIIYILNFF